MDTPNRASASRARRAAAILALAILLAALPAAAALAEPANEADRYGGYVFDGLILRPAGVALLVFGSVFAIPSYPLSMISGSQKIVLERCVLDPYDYTFTRKIGDF